jgi:hypothetical protein
VQGGRQKCSFPVNLDVCPSGYALRFTSLGFMSMWLTAELRELKTLRLAGHYLALGSDDNGVLRRLLNQLTAVQFVGTGDIWSKWAGPITSSTLQTASFARHNGPLGLAPVDCPNLQEVCLQQKVWV